MNEKITYKDAGVDVELADSVIGSLTERLRGTFRPEVMGRMGGFAALFRPQWKNYADPVLVSATDGVGTKLKIAFMTGIHDTVGIDLVAMNVNDLLVTGAEPLFFLDYFATGGIDPAVMTAVISGIARGCHDAGCALIGGETAEMPGLYAAGEYDLAGFCVGIVDAPSIVDGRTMTPGDVVLGIPSTGLHSNGFSLVRKVLLERKRYSLDTVFADLGRSLGEELLTPTAIYVKPVLELLKETRISAMAHITGGGFAGNVPRVTPESCTVVIRKDTWVPAPIFRMIQRDAGLDDAEMYRTFNMGIGLVLTVAETEATKAVEVLRRNGLDALAIGEVVPRSASGEAFRLC